MIDDSSMTPVQKVVLTTLLDGDIYTTKRLINLCDGAVPRDVIKGLRRLGYLIHGRGRWCLDERHISGDAKAELIASAESGVQYCNNSLIQAKREAERIPSAFYRKEEKCAELAKLKSSPDINSY